VAPGEVAAWEGWGEEWRNEEALVSAAGLTLDAGGVIQLTTEP